MRQRRIALGIIARAFYLLWTLFVLALGWLTWEGRGTAQGLALSLSDLFTLYVGGLAVSYALMWVVSAVRETDWYENWVRRGQGGSARWGGVLAFLKYAWWRIKLNPKAPIYLGRTLHKYDPWPWCHKIGVDDENHLVTIAQARSGKSTTAIWPNLVRYPYPDSVFVLDPKGEHAQMTSRHRLALGQRVYVLDPFGVTSGLETHCFNPLAEIDPSSGRAKEDIAEIAEAFAISAATSISDTGEHFADLRQSLITGLIAHVLTTEPKERHTLPAVYDYFMELRNDEAFHHFLDAMEANMACGKAPLEAAAAYRRAGKNEKGSIFTTVLNALKWIASDDMQRHLSHSDFSLEELRTHRTSLYVVLDFDAMDPDKQGRYMRVLVNLALRKSYVTPLPEERKDRRTLFILDEVAQLGHMPKIQDAFRTHAGAHIKLWPFFQDWEALTSSSSSPRALIGNSTKQFFGCNDPETAEQIEKHLGEYLHRRKDGVRTHEATKPLLDATEIMRTLKQKSPGQIVIPGGGGALELKRETYISGAEVVASEEEVEKDNFIKELIRAIRIYLRIRGKKEKIAQTRDLLRAVQSELSDLNDIGRNLNELKRRASSHESWPASAEDAKERLAGYEQVLQPGDVMGKFKHVVEDAHVKEHLDKFSDLPKYCHLHHAGEINSIFRHAATLIPPEEILELVDYIESSDVLRQSASVDFGHCYLSDDIFLGMHGLARRCSVENKMELYYKLDDSGYLEDRLPRQTPDSVAHFVADAFEGIETDTAVAVLRASPSWKAVTKDQILRDWIIDRDERLLPAVEKGPEPEPLTDAEEHSFILRFAFRDCEDSYEYSRRSPEYRRRRYYEEFLAERRQRFSSHRNALPQWARAVDEFPFQSVAEKAGSDRALRFKQKWEDLYNCFLRDTPDETKHDLEKDFLDLVEACKREAVLPEGYRYPFVEEKTVNAEPEPNAQEQDEPRDEEKAPEPDLEEEVQKAETAHQTRKEEELYTPKQNEVRELWNLQIGYTREQLDARYGELIIERPDSEADALSDQYNILLPAAL